MKAKSNIKVAIGSSSISILTRRMPSEETIQTIINMLDKTCPENNKMEASVCGFGMKIGKNVNWCKVLIGLGTAIAIYYSGKLVYKLVIDKAQDNSNLSSEEKQQKKKDAEVKEWISKELGLFNASNPTVSTLGEGERTEVKYLVDSIVKVGDRLVLASPPGHGKSILATQLGIAIAKGVVPEFLPQNTEACEPQRVLLYDGELDKDDVSTRYGGITQIPYFTRLSGCKYRTIYYLLKDIYVKTTEAGRDMTIILDNLFALMPGMSSEETRTFFDGLDLIQGKISKSGHNLTFIIITHTTKETDGVPDLKNIAGSAHITRFAKSVMSLVKDDDVVILTGTKCRYDKEQGSYELQLVEEPYVHFERAEAKEEAKERRQGNSSKYDEDTKREIFNLRNSEQYDLREIADRLKKDGVDISHTTVGKLYKEFLCELGYRIFNLHVEGEHLPTFDEIAKKLRIEGLRVDEAKVVELYHQYCEGNGIDPDNP